MWKLQLLCPWSFGISTVKIRSTPLKHDLCNVSRDVNVSEPGLNLDVSGFGSGTFSIGWISGSGLDMDLECCGWEFGIN